MRGMDCMSSSTMKAGTKPMGSSNLLTASGGSHYPGHRQEIGSERVG